MVMALMSVSPKAGVTVLRYIEVLRLEMAERRLLE